MRRSSLRGRRVAARATKALEEIAAQARACAAELAAMAARLDEALAAMQRFEESSSHPVIRVPAADVGGGGVVVSEVQPEVTEAAPVGIIEGVVQVAASDRCGRHGDVVGVFGCPACNSEEKWRREQRRVSARPGSS